MPRNNSINFRRGTYTQWDAQATGVLDSGEPGYISDFNKLKIGDGVTQWSDLTATNDNLTTMVINKTASTIPKMSVVYINGAQGDLPSITLSLASGESSSSKTYGLTVGAIAPDAVGQVVVDGALKNLNTLTQFSGVTPGTTLWLSPTVSGGITTSKPYAPYHMVSIGNLIRVHQNQGVINVKIQNGFELEELHNVAVTGATNGQFLQYNSGSGLWVPSSSGNFTSLSVNNTGVSLSGHTHSSSNITDFNSSLSGLLPVKDLIAGSGISLNNNNGIFTIINNGGGGGGGGINAVTRGSFLLTTSSGTFNIDGGYTVGSLDVFLNGVKLSNSGDYIASNGTSFSLTNPAISGSIIEYLALVPGVDIANATGSGLLTFNTSPTFSGVPIVPTASGGTNTNQIASTAFVINEINNISIGSGGGVNITNSGINRLLINDGSASGIIAQTNLTFNGSLLSIIGSGLFNNNVIASGFVRTNGTSTEFLKADGSVDNTVYANATDIIAYSLIFG